MSERVILAYSGGLDTSVAISWIGKETGREVVAVAIDLGQGGEDMDVVRQRALDCGAVEEVFLELEHPDGRSRAVLLTVSSTEDRAIVRSGALFTATERRAYELELDIAWDTAANVGVSVGRSADGSRRTNIGKYGGGLYVDRAPSDLAGYSLVPYTRAAAPIDANAKSVHLRIFVDTQSVEVFVNAGHTVLSQQVHFDDGDTSISFYADGGPATFSGITIKEFGNPI